MKYNKKSCMYLTQDNVRKRKTEIRYKENEKNIYINKNTEKYQTIK